MKRIVLATLATITLSGCMADTEQDMKDALLCSGVAMELATRDRENSQDWARYRTTLFTIGTDLVDEVYSTKEEKVTFLETFDEQVPRYLKDTKNTPNGVLTQAWVEHRCEELTLAYGMEQQ
ncbi:lipoprotein [Vibrio breoganii]